MSPYDPRNPIKWTLCTLSGQPLNPLLWWPTAEKAMTAAAIKFGTFWYSSVTVERLYD
jgi:hypothetical protein